MEMETIVARAQALVQTTSTPGWPIVLELMQSALDASREQIMDCRDATQLESLVHKAQAAREFFRAFQSNLEAEKAPLFKNTSFIPMISEVQVPE
jgi:hypothetical protein